MDSFFHRWKTNFRPFCANIGFLSKRGRGERSSRKFADCPPDNECLFPLCVSDVSSRFVLCFCERQKFALSPGSRISQIDVSPARTLRPFTGNFCAFIARKAIFFYTFGKLFLFYDGCFCFFFAGPPLRLGRVFDVNIQAFIVGILRMVLVKVSKCNSFQWTFFMLKLGIDFVYSIENFSCNLIIEFYLFRNLCDLSFVEKF